VHLFAWHGARLVGGVLVLLRRVPGLGDIGYASYGPVLAADAEERADVARALALGLRRLPRVRMLFLQPAGGTDDVRDVLLACGFRPSSAGIAPVGSTRLDLDRSEDDIRQGFPPRLRSWTRRWPDAGVTVRKGGPEDVPILADLMRATAEARGYPAPPRLPYLQHMYDELSRTGNAALFVGEVHGTPVTADLVTMCGCTVRGRLSGFDRSGEGRRLSVPGAARWEMIRWAKREGYRWLDFGGLSEATLRDLVDRGVRRSDDWPSTDRAKLQFGGVAFRYPGAVELITPRWLQSAYDAAAKSEWGSARLEQVKVRMRSRRAG
jgi:lipid II:glycine glycyltransferase (peptidoglycan interpeptide bridge formation enzyme)